MYGSNFFEKHHIKQGDHILNKSNYLKKNMYSDCQLSMFLVPAIFLMKDHRPVSISVLKIRLWTASSTVASKFKTDFIYCLSPFVSHLQADCVLIENWRVNCL